MKIFKKLSAIMLMTFVAATSMVSLTANAKTAIKGYGVLVINFDPTFTVNKKTIMNSQAHGTIQMI